MEILLFSLGTHETFGINVFKVREVSKTPIDHQDAEHAGRRRGPDQPARQRHSGAVAGQRHAIWPMRRRALGGSMMVTEYSKRTLGFLVHGVDRIIRVDWDKVRAPEVVVTGGSHAYITAITELPDGKLVSILDVEQILANTFGEAIVGQIERIEAGGRLQRLLRRRFGGGAQEDRRGARQAGRQAQARPQRPGSLDALVRHGQRMPAARPQTCATRSA